MKKYLFIFFISFVFFTNSQVIQEYDTLCARFDKIYSTKKVEDGVIISGYKKNSDNEKQVILFKINENGQVVWTTEHSSNIIYDVPINFDFQILNDGYIYGVSIGYTNIINDDEQSIWRVNSTNGEIAWIKSDLDLYFISDDNYAAATSNINFIEYDSTSIICSYTTYSEDKVILAKHSKENFDRIKYTAIYDYNNFQYEQSIAIDDGQNVYLGTNQTLRKFNKDNFDQIIWVRQYDLTGWSGILKITNVYIDKYDDLYIFGISQTENSYVFKIDKNNGNQIWTNLDYSQDLGFNEAVAKDFVDYNGFLYITHRHIYVGSVVVGMYTCKVDKSNGIVIWRSFQNCTTLGANTFDGTESANSIDRDCNGDLYLTGYYDDVNYGPANWGIMKLSEIDGSKIYDLTITQGISADDHVSEGIGAYVFNNTPIFLGNVEIFDTYEVMGQFVKINPSDGLVLERDRLRSENIGAATISIISSDDNNVICPNSPVTFSASIANGGLSPVYQWKLNGVNVGTNSATYYNSNLTNGDFVTCDLTSSDVCATSTSAISNSISTNVVSGILPTIVISSSDLDNLICSGTSIVFSSSITDGGTNPSYQWKINGVNVAGQTSSTFTTNNIANNDIVTCELTSNVTCASQSVVTSPAIQLSVTPSITPSVSISSNDSDNTICNNHQVDFTATILNGGTTPSYTWKINGLIVGTNSPTFSSNSLLNMDVVTCTINSNEMCQTTNNASSNILNFSVLNYVNPSITVSSTNPNNIFCAGSPADFTSGTVFGGTNPQYQWKLNGNNISGANSATYSTTSLSDADEISCELISDYLCLNSNNVSSNSITYTILPNLIPALSITSTETDNSICDGSSITFNSTPLNEGTNPQYQWKINDANVLGETSTSFTSTNLNDQDVVSCQLTSDETCVTSPTVISSGITTSVIPTVTPSVNITSDDTDLIICGGNTITFMSNRINEGSSPTYAWKVNGSSVGTSTSFSSSTLSNNDIVSFELTNLDECVIASLAISNSLSITVNPNLSPTLSIISTDPDNSICSGTSVNFASSATNEGTNPTYNWKINGLNVSSGPSFSNSSLQDNDVVSCELLSSEECLTDASVISNQITMNINVFPIISFGAINNTSSCSSSDGGFVINGSGNGILTWTGSNPGSENVSLPTTVSNLPTGSYSFTFNDGCVSNTATGTISSPTPPAVPTINISGSLTFCEGQTRTLSSSISSNILWSTGETSQSITVAESGTYFVTHTLSGCSSTSDVRVITVNPNPSPAVISASGATTFCNGESIVLSSNLTSGNSWSTGASSQSITVTSSGNYSITTTANGCTSTSNVISVSVNPVPSIVMGSLVNVSSCGGTDGIIEIIGSGNGTISWTGAANGSLSGFLPFQIQNLIPGAYAVTFNNGCNSNTINATIEEPNVPNPPTISASGATTFCQGGSVTLTSSISSGNVWSNGLTSQSITVNQAGNYSSTLTTSPGCNATSNVISISINPIPATPTITANGPTTFCDGASVILSSSATNNNSWTGGGTNQNLTVTSSGIYTVAFTENGCSATSSPINVFVNAIPTAPTITASGSTIFCEGESVILISDFSDGLLWSTGASGSSIEVNSTGIFFVTRTLNNCSSSSNSVTTTVNPTPNVSLTSIPDVCDTADVILLNQGSPAGGIYMVNDMSATSFTPNSNNIGVNTVEYSFTENNCTGTANTTITVIDCSTGVGLVEQKMHLKLFPNPSTGLIEISGITKEEIESITVFDQVGKLILTVKNSTQINLTPFSSGLYTILIQASNFESVQKVELIK